MRITVKSMSYSTYSQYLGCPEAVWLGKIKKVKPVGVAANLAFGSAIHTAAETHYRHIKTPLSAEMLLRMFKGSYESFPQEELVYGEKQSKADLYKTAEQLLTLLAAEEPPADIVAVEDPHVVDLDALKIIQRVDLVTREKDEHGESGLVLWDLKTSRNRYGDEDRAKVTEQLSLYGMAYDEPIKGLRCKVLLKQKAPSIENIDLPYDADAGPAVVQEMLQVKEAIEKGIHFKVKSFRCASCSFRHVCQSKENYE